MKIDLGCGPNKKEGFIGVDQFAFPNVDHVVQIGREPLPFADGEVEEVHASHFVEHLNAAERCSLFNELFRVMKPGAKMTMIVPHWGSSRAYGDPTHQWPPVVEMFWYYLSKTWREANAPHVPLTCDLAATWGYNVGAPWNSRNQETQMFAVNHYRNVAMDMVATVAKV